LISRTTGGVSIRGISPEDEFVDTCLECESWYVTGVGVRRRNSPYWESVEAPGLKCGMDTNGICFVLRRAVIPQELG
jgi:hypothetical protein